MFKNFASLVTISMLSLSTACASHQGVGRNLPDPKVEQATTENWVERIARNPATGKMDTTRERSFSQRSPGAVRADIQAQTIAGNTTVDSVRAANPTAVVVNQGGGSRFGRFLSGMIVVSPNDRRDISGGSVVTHCGPSGCNASVQSASQGVDNNAMCLRRDGTRVFVTSRLCGT